LASEHRLSWLRVGAAAACGVGMGVWGSWARLTGSRLDRPYQIKKKKRVSHVGAQPFPCFTYHSLPTTAHESRLHTRPALQPSPNMQFRAQTSHNQPSMTHPINAVTVKIVCKRASTTPPSTMQRSLYPDAAACGRPRARVVVATRQTLRRVDDLFAMLGGNTRYFVVRSESLGLCMVCGARSASRGGRS
jgi:hypothetical protein